MDVITYPCNKLIDGSGNHSLKWVKIQFPFTLWALNEMADILQTAAPVNRASATLVLI